MDGICHPFDFLLDAFVFANKLLNKGNVFVHQAGENALVVSCANVFQGQVGGNKRLLATCNALVDYNKKVFRCNVAVDVFCAKVINEQCVYVQQVFQNKLLCLQWCKVALQKCFVQGV